MIKIISDIIYFLYYINIKNNEDGGDRTHDHMLKRHALYLSELHLLIYVYILSLNYNFKYSIGKPIEFSNSFSMQLIHFLYL